MKVAFPSMIGSVDHFCSDVFEQTFYRYWDLPSLQIPVHPVLVIRELAADLTFTCVSERIMSGMCNSDTQHQNQAHPVEDQLYCLIYHYSHIMYDYTSYKRCQTCRCWPLSNCAWKSQASLFASTSCHLAFLFASARAGPDHSAEY